MENLNELQRLISASKAIKEAFDKWDNIYEKDPETYDKTGFGFNEDDRFPACKGLLLRVDNWKGVYGNSGCSTFFSIDSNIFNAHLLKVLSADFRNIMNKVSESIYEEAKTKQENATKELEKTLENVRNF